MGKEYLETQEKWTREHRLNPTVGDYWEDHFCPVMLVLEVTEHYVVVCETKKAEGPKHWTWDLSKTRILSRDEFAKKPLYDKTGTGGIGDRCWCHVHPGSHIEFVDIWRSLPTKIVTDTPHFSQRFLEVV